MTQRVFFFGGGAAEGTKDMKNVLGGKGANLAEMTNLGVPVPPGFTIACSECISYLRDGKYSDQLRAQVEGNIARLEAVTGKKFGDPRNPLLVSVRSGAPVSMPGMMETILNLGLNDRTVIGLAQQSQNESFANESYQRFIKMYSDVVECAPPKNPVEQLWGAIEAVWKSWTLKKARDYRRVNGIPEDLGTAVNVVAMVFGNLGDDSGTGVAFTRNPSTGEKKFYGEFLVNAQGEDVVAGIRTPLNIDEMAQKLPGAYKELLETQERLERHYRDMQDIEFTVERGKLYLLQTRSGKRTAAAAIRIAQQMVDEGLIDKIEAVKRVPAAHLDQILHPVIDPSTSPEPLCVGLPASPGAASGMAVFDPNIAEQRAADGDSVILIREETTPEDFHGIVAARAVLTSRGGMTSHAAVVARGMGKCAVVGCTDVKVDLEHRRFSANGSTIVEGDWLTLDGATGRVFAGDLPTIPSEIVRVLTGALPPKQAPTYQSYTQLMGWADEARKLKVRANADTPKDAQVARGFGAEGIGLCRTEHMFFEGDRITAMREMIVARDEGGRRRALAKLLPMQRADFEGIFEAMNGLPVTIRLLDPPLHEFLPHGGEESKLLARTLGLARAELSHIVESLRETNPMLGHRGCRLGITYPEITEMQGRAIFEAAVRAMRRGIDVRPEIMVPLVSSVKELDHQRAILERAADQVLGAMGERVPYLIGTMIELPRAALTADQIAQSADFFSFGTNDLTQTTLGMSRDDAGRFLPSYVERGIFPDDPFQVLDVDGVGRLIRIAAEDGRKTRQNLKLGICGEHGGEPKSVAFCHAAGFDYVSCSPYRVPIARLAAAHAALNETK